MSDKPVQEREDPDKEELTRRLQDAQLRLRRLEWEADVMRRQQGNQPSNQKE